MSLADELLADLEDENDNDDLEEKLGIKDEPIDDDEMDSKEHVFEEMEIDVSVTNSSYFQCNFPTLAILLKSN